MQGQTLWEEELENVTGFYKDDVDKFQPASQLSPEGNFTSDVSVLQRMKNLHDIDIASAKAQQPEYFGSPQGKNQQA